jgi:hypothetical protein
MVPKFVIEDLDHVNSCAYFDYQRERFTFAPTGGQEAFGTTSNAEATECP